ncbi:MAG: hypothetical protein E7069_09860 [Bacteroidales bacterium]|jgi:hypothetical protein|nr:hypothetical protein [Bacteroidales bacterium]
MYRVKIITGQHSDFDFFRMTKNCDGVSLDGRYKFYVDEEIDSPDFLVVRNRKFVREPLHYNVAKENTILAISEPESVLHFSHTYAQQFASVLGCQLYINHRNVKPSPAILSWTMGLRDKGAGSITYNNLKNQPFPKKTKLISVITSNKIQTRGHVERIRFVQRLKERYGNKIDVFGRGINDFDDRWDVLAPYKYHIAIENCSEPHYWTEKLSECFLAGAFPIYYGCTNVGDYFPKGAYASIDINDFEAACAVIDKILAEDTYEQALPYLYEAKELILERYNALQLIAAHCDTLNANAPKSHITILPEKKYLNFRQIFREVVISAYYKLKFALLKHFIH